MGIDQMAVVDPQLKVIEGLRVVDASIMPTMITGNTNGNYDWRKGCRFDKSWNKIASMMVKASEIAFRRTIKRYLTL